MGCDTVGYTKTKIDVLKLAKIINTKLNSSRITNIEVYHDDCFRINFKYVDEDRSLFVCENHDNRKLGKYYLSLGLWGSSVKIMETILSFYGGIMKDNDCGSDDYRIVEKE